LTRVATEPERVTKQCDAHGVGGAVATAPYWVKLTRSGSTITAYQSANGSTWSRVGAATINMSANVLVGLVVSSHSTTVPSTATFDGVSTSSWVDEDIGAVGLAGNTRITGGTFSLQGAGADVFGTADAFHYTYQRMTGDGQITARVATIQNTNVWVKSGVMIRNTLAANSAHAFMLVSPGKGTALQSRAVGGGTSLSIAGPVLTAPRWVRLVRAGSVFTAYHSADGVTWSQVGSQTITMGSTVYVGLAFSSHSATVLGSGTIDNVSR
jgi:regulation of enolase protein 1 (concanavalin A-like superfamily)